MRARRRTGVGPKGAESSEHGRVEHGVEDGAKAALAAEAAVACLPAATELAVGAELAVAARAAGA
eukprot:1229585-Prymnesium_polylepis.1